MATRPRGRRPRAAARSTAAARSRSSLPCQRTQLRTYRSCTRAAAPRGRAAVAGLAWMDFSTFFALAVPLVAAAATPARAPCRDRWLEPFSSDSIWNTAIGSGAEFRPAGLFDPDDPRGVPDNCTMPPRPAHLERFHRDSLTRTCAVCALHAHSPQRPGLSRADNGARSTDSLDQPGGLGRGQQMRGAKPQPQWGCVQFKLEAAGRLRYRDPSTPRVDHGFRLHGAR